MFVTRDAPFSESSLSFGRVCPPLPYDVGGRVAHGEVPDVSIPRSFGRPEADSDQLRNPLWRAVHRGDLGRHVAVRQVARDPGTTADVESRSGLAGPDNLGPGVESIVEPVRHGLCWLLTLDRVGWMCRWCASARPPGKWRPGLP